MKLCRTIKSSNKIRNLEFINSTNWDDIFNIWKENEANCKEHKLLIKKRGFSNWDMWRDYLATNLDLQNRDWVIYRITKKFEFITNSLVGPFLSWQRFFNSNDYKKNSFISLKNNNILKSNYKIQSIAKNFPSTTFFIGIYLESIGKVLLIDGHHRASAYIFYFSKIKLMSLFDDREIKIAITEFSTKDEEIIVNYLNNKHMI